jgi:hypothetical protein
MAEKSQQNSQPRLKQQSKSQLAAEPKPNVHATLERWIWVLIYGGLFLMSLGIATARINSTLGWSMAVPGAVVALVGFVLIYVRSRLN